MLRRCFIKRPLVVGLVRAREGGREEEEEEGGKEGWQDSPSNIPRP